MVRFTFLSLLTVVAALFVGCTTSGQFRVPPNTKLVVTDREATIGADGKWETSPFFWKETGGARYRLYDGSGKILRSGKLKTRFRAVSIFWPPGGIIYWPMGFYKEGVFDLTKPADGFLVKDDPSPSDSGEAIAPAKTKTKK